MIRSRLAVPLFVLVAALAIRLQPVVGESFHYDALVHQEAAAHGITANAWDHDDTWRLRRYHPPLISYVILANNALFGGGLTGARVFAMIFGAAACVLVAVAVLVFGRRRHPGGNAGAPSAPGTTSGAAAAGLMLAFLPVHLYISRSANWDAVYSAFAAGTLLALALHLKAPCRRRVWAAGVLWALAFLTCELAVALLPAVAAVWWADRRRDNYTARPWLAAAAASVVLITVLWPAGVLHLDVIRTLRFRWYDSTAGARNAPWTDFYSTLWRQAPAYAVAAAIGMIVLVRAARRKARGRDDDTPALLPLLPFAVYAVTVVALSTRQRLVYIHHIADLFPALTVLMGAAFVTVFARLRSAGGRAAVAAFAVAAVAFTVYAGTRDDPDVVGPQEHPGLATLGEFLEAHPGARTYFHYSVQMEYYAPGADVVGSAHRHWTADEIAEAKVGDYDYVVSDRSMLEGDFISSPEALENALKPQYRLEEVIRHRRTGEPVVWIFSRRR